MLFLFLHFSRFCKDQSVHYCGVSLLNRLWKSDQVGFHNKNKIMHADGTMNNSNIQVLWATWSSDFRNLCQKLFLLRYLRLTNIHVLHVLFVHSQFCSSLCLPIQSKALTYSQSVIIRLFQISRWASTLERWLERRDE